MKADNDLKEIQHIILDIFREVDKICERNNLRYFAIGGTCLGAVRHKGFIPWDDDLDIAMPRKDYEAFIKIAEKELPHNLSLLIPKQAKYYECTFAKVQDVNTTFIQDIAKPHPERYTGVYIDIMPLDGLPDDVKERKKHFLKLKINFLCNAHRKCKSGDLHTGIKRVLGYLTAFAAWCRTPFDWTYYYKKYEEECKKYDFEKSDYTSYAWSLRASKLVFPTKDFEDYVMLPFEDYHMRCPIGYEDFLQIMFGDYMKLPPKEEQVPMHSESAVIDLHKSYKRYQRNVYRIRRKI